MDKFYYYLWGAVALIMVGMLLYFNMPSSREITTASEREAKEAELAKAIVDKINSDTEKYPPPAPYDYSKANSVAPIQNWSYSEDFDKMRSTTTKYAQVESNDVIYLSSPYNGGTRTTLYLRKNPGGSNEAFIQVSQGQLLDYEQHISVKFDDSPVQNYSVSGTASGRSNALFISSASQFISKLKKTEHLIIEAPFYEDGRRQIEFSVAGLEWK